ncbi:MAG: hypothetical protein GX440_12670 [Propionibacterium sp.]|jgi:uncharacterized membrane-anchored protein|nr:hypothetical protein [Propionibacterium sp.]
MTPETLRGMEIGGTVVVLIGIIFWYSTPSDVVAAPIMVILVGAVLAAIPWWVKRNQSDQSANELAQKVRAERERNDRQN